MKLLWLGYVVYSLGNCVMKLCIETGLIVPSSDLTQWMAYVFLTIVKFLLKDIAMRSSKNVTPSFTSYGHNLGSAEERT